LRLQVLQQDLGGVMQKIENSAKSLLPRDWRVYNCEFPSTHLYGYESHHIMLTEVSFTGSNWTRLRPDLTARSTTSFRSRNSPEPTSSSVRMEKTGTASPAPFQGAD
jgi:hypothetical protein